MSLLRVLSVLVVAGVLAIHALPAAHHGSGHAGSGAAPDVTASAVAHGQHAVADGRHSEDTCDLACEAGAGVMMLCGAVIGAVLGLLFAHARRGWSLSRRVRPPLAVTLARRPLRRPPDPAAELCISRT